MRIKGRLYCCMGLMTVHVGFRTGFELKVVERRVAIDISEFKNANEKFLVFGLGRCTVHNSAVHIMFW